MRRVATRIHVECFHSTWRRWLLSIRYGALLGAFILIAGCSSGGNNAATNEPAPADSLAADPDVREILANSCFDCHSDAGSGSWMAAFAPSYLFGASKGRQVINFSTWSTLNAAQRSAAASAIAAVVDSGSMPPGDYDFFHPSARLTDHQKQLLLQ
ncbi:MAG: heme-binding domain-containing protein [Candidatus Binataceae bacterium]